MPSRSFSYHEMPISFHTGSKRERTSAARQNRTRRLIRNRQCGDMKPTLLRQSGNLRIGMENSGDLPMRILTALFLLIAAPVGAQTHCDVHYRWQEKIDATHIAGTVASTTVSQMLTWSSPAFTAAETYWCQVRNTREQTVYQLTAWARRLKVQNGATGDGDWHIELTGSKTSAVTNCIVIEIPPDTLNPVYFQARQNFLATITDAGSIIKSTGDVVPAVRVKAGRAR